MAKDIVKDIASLTPGANATPEFYARVNGQFVAVPLSYINSLIDDKIKDLPTQTYADGDGVSY